MLWLVFLSENLKIAHDTCIKFCPRKSYVPPTHLKNVTLKMACDTNFFNKSMFNYHYPMANYIEVENVDDTIAKLEIFSL